MSYEPRQPDRGINPEWLYDELQRISTEAYRPSILIFDVLHAEPQKPLEGMVVFADGSDWNPTGAGGGLHQYLSGAWDRL